MLGIEKLDRFQIEAVYAFEMCKHNTANAADMMHITYAALYNDLTRVKERTGLNPYKPKQFKELYEAIEDYRKEKMRGANFDIGSYLCGE